MPFACPVYKLGPPVNGVYTYHARHCPGATFAPLHSEDDLPLNGCHPDGTPGPGCRPLPPPAGPANPGGTGPTPLGVAEAPFHVGPVLGDRGLTERMAWLDPSPTTSPDVSIVNSANIKFWDSVRYRWTAARLHLFFVHVEVPGGGRLPPLHIGVGWELAEDTIPQADRDSLIMIPQTAARSVARYAHAVDFAGVTFVTFTRA